MWDIRRSTFPFACTVPTTRISELNPGGLRMTQTSDRTPPSRTSSAASQTDHSSQPTSPSPSSRRVRRVPRITVEFGCLMCSRDFGILVCESLPVCGTITIQQPGGFHVEFTVNQLRYLRCPSCRGSILPTEIIREEVRVERRIDWSEDRPKRGRPPKWLVEQRRKSAQERDAS